MGINISKLSVLVVEDTIPMRSIICSVLMSLGISDFVTAPNGEVGFEIFRKNKPDIVITDWVMEQGDGIELTRLIRKSAYSSDRLTPIIMVTGYAARGRVSEARDAGVTEYLVKPFTAALLARRISYVINKPRDFIDFSEYFGPDRRRRSISEYVGPMRREIDRSSMYVVG